MTDLDVPTAVREMLDRSTDAVRLRHSDGIRLDAERTVSSAVPSELAGHSLGMEVEEVDLRLVDLTAPPRRNRRVLVAAALVAAAAVGGGFAVAASSGPDPVPERTGMATAPSAPPSPAEGADRGASGDAGAAPADVGARLRFDGDQVTLQVVGSGELVESVPVSDDPPAPGAAADLFASASVVRVGPPAGAPAPDEWNGTVHLASGEPAALRTDGDGRTLEIDAGDVVIVFGDIDPSLAAEDLARMIGGLHLERAD